MIRMRYLKNVSTFNLNSEICIGCGLCTQVCPHQILAIVDKKVQLTDIDLCMECGACQMNCPTGAITVNTGVGCSAAIIEGRLRGKEPTCGCCEDSNESSLCC